jgi:4-hydroxythreonine-4-phosphate dehydrogenase
MFWIGISIGDVSGVGPEITLKALGTIQTHPMFRWIIFGPNQLLQDWNIRFGSPVKLQSISDLQQYPVDLPEKTVCVYDAGIEMPPYPTQGGVEVGRCALKYLELTASEALNGHLCAMVTAPLNKSAVMKTGVPFIGQTEHLTHMAGNPDTAMMLLGCDERERWLRVALATTHLPISKVPGALNQKAITRIISLAAQACLDLGLSRQKVGVCGLNPHAGESGTMGREEIDIISPAVIASQKLKLDVEGPFPADSLFYHAYRGEFDAIVSMYHDQGLTPLKMIGFDRGINWTLGLPFIRTSPDHGTAYNIAGKNIAQASSMIEAMELAQRLAVKKPKVDASTTGN